jgi:hypothetical protein
MEIMRAGLAASGKGPIDWFTGTVRIDPLFNPFGEHEVLWGRLVTGRRYMVSGQMQQGCESPSFATAHPIQIRAA